MFANKSIPNMKKYSIFLLLIIFFVACEEDEKIETVVAPPPTVNNGPIDFSSNPLIFSPTKSNTQKVVLVSNDTTPLQYSIIDQPDWVFLGQMNGVIYDLHDFYVSIDQNRSYPFGILKDSIEFFTRVGRSYLEVRYVNGDGDQVLHEDTIFISALSDTTRMQLYNNTLSSIDFNLNAPAEIMVNPANGNIGAGSSESVLLTANRNSIPDSTVYYNITLNHGTVSKTIVVKVETFKEDKIILNGNVIDAEYDNSHNKLYYITSNPAAIVQFDPNTKLSSSTSLNNIPLCLSLSNSGNYAVVGNDGNATFLNLQTMSVISNFNTGVRAADIMLKDSSYAYVLPKNGQHVRMSCINLQNNYFQSSHIGSTIYQNARGKLHPTQQAIYTVANDVSPIDLDKFNISGGTASYLYDSPYHGTYNFGGDLWFSTNGSRIFTRGKAVVSASTSSNIDMVYSGTISLNIPASIKGNRSDWEFEIRHINVAQRGKMVIVAEDDFTNINDKIINQVYIHHESNLQYERRIETEDFAVPDFTLNQYTYYPAEPYFAFYTANINEVLIITKATNSGLSQQFAIELVTY